MQRPRRDDVLELEIADLAFGGAGVARHDGFVVFCRDTAPGDRVRAVVRKSRRRFAEADLLEVLEPGPPRTLVPCPYVPRCGGCRLQHVDYATALAAKRDQLAEHLVRIGHLEGVEVREPDAALEPFAYRNKMEYSAAPGADGGPAIGFHERGRWDRIVDVHACMLTTPLGNAVRETVRAWAVAEGVEPYDQRAGAGTLRHVVVREGVATGEVLVAVVTAPGAEAVVDRLADPLAAAHPEVVGLLHMVNEGVAETTAGLPTRLVRGRDWIEERVAGVALRLSAAAFFQTNTRMTDVLYRRVAEAAGLDGTQVLYDLFAGVGSIGIALAGGAREVVAIEIVPEAVADAERNARANGIANHTALCGDVGVVLRERRGELPPPDVAVVDPPRAGLAGRAVRRILELAPPTLVYVSCQPATFADNAARFVEGGYRLEWVRPVDMFPQTPHIEAVARFTR
ncbi:23S rRNA (uracil(1939)-C(5))-methyltransferase RlmD [Miltoncostaea marina]|uniref:23S rRNA (uracil(1939)-C(5))-methyltransferase RlmD n=1 Tax=Miltoncostaea marina TaxID=2843215 RepID=UPI001C3E6C08|nr:23S rRNA (uracil(1939)-C(5))-methyltransferase RlmD [Miltoncostaea marina]